MSSLNTRKVPTNTTNSVGTPVSRIDTHSQLVRTVSCSLLWEDSFYIDGVSSARVIAELIAASDPEFVASLAEVVRKELNLRHTPLFMLAELSKLGKLKARHVYSVISRPDELAELLAIYWKDGRKPIGNQLRKGIAEAFTKFSEYQFSKYKGKGKNITLRDVMFLVHPKPLHASQAAVFQRIADASLATPDTWEVALSGGADMRDTFSRLMQENKLGALAFLRNLRNMCISGVPYSSVLEYSREVDLRKVLPFRLLAAANSLTEASWKQIVYDMFTRAGKLQGTLPGHTVIVLDVSGSMHAALSGSASMTRASAALAASLVTLSRCEKVTMFATAGYDWEHRHATERLRITKHTSVPDVLKEVQQATNKLGGGGIFFAPCMEYVASNLTEPVDRVLVITDEQDTSGREYNPSAVRGLAPKDRNYIINVGTYKNGINNSNWLTISGMSASVVDFIHLHEVNTLMEQVEKLCLEKRRDLR